MRDLARVRHNVIVKPSAIAIALLFDDSFYDAQHRGLF